MKELVTTEQAAHALRWAAIVLPLAGLLMGAVGGALRRRLAGGALLGLLVGMLGPAVYGLWFVYNGIMGRYGLDSVKGLLLNLALFAVIGLAAGIAVGRVLSRRAAARSEEASPRPGQA